MALSVLPAIFSSGWKEWRLSVLACIFHEELGSASERQHPNGPPFNCFAGPRLCQTTLLPAWRSRPVHKQTYRKGFATGHDPFAQLPRREPQA